MHYTLLQRTKTWEKTYGKKECIVLKRKNSTSSNISIKNLVILIMRFVCLVSLMERVLLKILIIAKAPLHSKSALLILINIKFKIYNKNINMKRALTT